MFGEEPSEPYDLRFWEEAELWRDRHPDRVHDFQLVREFVDALRADPLSFEATPVPGMPEGYVTREAPGTDVFVTWVADSAGRMIYLMRVESAGDPPS
jgi:hypothetical protein